MSASGLLRLDFAPGLSSPPPRAPTEGLPSAPFAPPPPPPPLGVASPPPLAIFIFSGMCVVKSRSMRHGLNTCLSRYECAASCCECAFLDPDVLHPGAPGAKRDSSSHWTPAYTSTSMGATCACASRRRTATTLRPQCTFSEAVSESVGDVGDSAPFEPSLGAVPEAAPEPDCAKKSSERGDETAAMNWRLARLPTTRPDTAARRNLPEASLPSKLI